MLRRIVATLILVPLAIVLIAFAVANRQGVTVSLDPFSAAAPAATFALPLFALIIGAVIVGVIVGGVAAWLGQGRWRRRAQRLAREADDLRRQVEMLQGPANGPSIVPREQSPPPRLKLKPPVRQ